MEGRGAFYDQTGTIRDVIQNHLFQILCNLAMEPPVRIDSETIRDEKVKVLKAIPPLEADNLVRGQFRGYRQERGVRSDSKMETFAALRLEIDSWRWKGVPFYIRAGKNLPVTCTEVLARFRKPPAVIQESALSRNHLRFRISPEMTIAIGTTVMAQGEEFERSRTSRWWRVVIPVQKKWKRTSAFWATRWPGMPLYLRARIMWKRLGESSIRC